MTLHVMKEKNTETKKITRHKGTCGQLSHVVYTRAKESGLSEDEAQRAFFLIQTGAMTYVGLTYFQIL